MCCEEAAIFFANPCIYPPYETKSLNRSSTTFKVKINKQSFLMSLMSAKRGPWVKNWEFGSDFFSFVKIPTQHQDLWGISTN